LVSFNFLPADREQLLLMPPSLAEWLPEDHEAWALIDAVEEMDLSAFYAGYRVDGWGRAAHHPKVMVTLLLYAYCQGVRSSRRIERACYEDVALRVIAANQQPDHATIARFRRRHLDALKGLFVETLRLCAAAGMVRVGLVALDGTKMKASASPHKNRSREVIAEQVTAMLAEAEAVDAAEDADEDATGGGGQSPGLERGRAARLARLRHAKAVLDSQEQAERDAFEAKMADRRAREAAHLAATGKRLNGRKPKPFTPDAQARVNVTDADSRIMGSPHGFVQGYNAQAMATCEQIVVAAAITDNAADVGQLHPMIDTAHETLQAAGVKTPIGAVVADAGYLSDENLTTPCEPELFIATKGGRRQRSEPIAPPRGPIPKTATPRQRMEHKLATKRGRRVYKQRAQTIEPIFGQIKHNRRVDRFLLRGRAGVETEWALLCATHNLLKLIRNRPAIA
jgi:transposase